MISSYRVLMLAAGELSGPVVTGWVLPYVGVRQWCGILAGVGLIVVFLYIVTFVCYKGKKYWKSATISPYQSLNYTNL